ncbi:unnamed protein product [Owenia fusiformis]|uniref:Fucosyltransferase n=1 Tax=Owenia fusiformis TaxID=6347 RepID=A0A8J1XF63_OWEFU|nr:unnamed protein product [Owenia fusiformis]
MVWKRVLGKMTRLTHVILLLGCLIVALHLLQYDRDKEVKDSLEKPESELEAKRWTNKYENKDRIVIESDNEMLLENESFANDAGHVDVEDIDPYDPTNCVILIWTLWNFNEFPQIGTELFKDCEESRCEVTLNKTRITEADAVLFWGQSYEFVSGKIPNYHAPSQIWVFVSREAMLRGYFQSANLAATRFAINRTMTYKLNSDIQWPYGYVKPKPDPAPPMLSRKRHLVAWLVSHCGANSMRMSFVKDLQRYVPVHIYGRCGNYSCPKDRVDCLSYLSENYMFYLAFENSDCVDYVTEKVWDNALLHNMIPVVRGKMTNFSAHLPPGSFVHVEEFATAEVLGKYLRKVGADFNLYTQYHNWRSSFDVFNGGQDVFRCNICRDIHKFRASGERKTVDLWEFINAKTQCFTYRIDLENLPNGLH